MIKLFSTLLLLTNILFAAQTAPKGGCVLSQKGPITVSWKAYKTPAKIGVGGVFTQSTYTPAKKEGKNFKEILVGSSIAISTSSVNSKNEGRDKKLVESFFKLFSDETIHAKVTDIKADKHEKGKAYTGTIMIDITLNGITKNVPMHYTYEKEMMHAKGYIDLFDFQGSKALASINKACFELHKGKTWNDVMIAFDMPITASSCNTTPITNK